MTVDGERFDALLTDLDAALGELVAAAGATTEAWSRAKPGKWTAGQHVDHVAVTLGLSDAALEERAPMLRAGTLRPRPWRGPLQSLWIRLVVQGGRLPRGGRAPAKFLPAASPDHAATLEKIRRLFESHRAVGEALSAADRDRLWIRNPFLSRWQYTLPEVIRVHSVHARHHARLVREIGAHPGLMRRTALAIVAIASLSATDVRADVVSDWNASACDTVAAANVVTPVANRTLAMVQTAVFEAVNAITKRYAVHDLDLAAPQGASVEAAVAAANRGVLSMLVPSQKAAIDSVYTAAIATIADAAGKAAGIEVGEKAAAGILARRAYDDPGPEGYRPATAPGVYVPTVVPVAPHWSQRKPWLMKSTDQFRPGPPPKLTSDTWARDYKEIKELGCKICPHRTTEQTNMARFWEATGPAIYHGIVRSVTTLPGRDITRNARLFAAVTQAADDAVIAVFEAKYHYNFWRPITAIRNGDRDDNAATERDSAWVPFIDTPMHPEYPCAHCIVSGALGTVLQADIGTGPMPTLAATSPTAKDLRRSWTRIDDFMQEVANGRIYDGVHFRFSTEVGTAMGKQVGALAVAKYMR